jgi:iron complex outermembrane receptor protein
MVKQLTTKLLTIAVILLSSLTVLAQSGAVTGVVTDAGDGTSLPGATIVIKGTTQGSVTDIDGNYTINAEANQVLVFSYVGYASQEFVAKQNGTINVALQSSALSLEGVVVIGYGVTKKEDATGAVTAIDAESFNKGSIVTPASLIAGKVAGVQISSNGGAPGTSSRILIRGGSSLNASNDPLIVVDGIPFSNDGTGGSRSPLNTINPNDIETFTVLKDASATAIYGSRASNGVIIITTKKGKVNKPLQLNYSGKFSYFEIPKTVGVLSSEEFQKVIKERFPKREDMLGTWADASGNPVPYTSDDAVTQTMHSTDWQKEIYRNTTSMDHALSATGAWKNLPYRFSLGYTDENGILQTSKFQRTSLSAALNQFYLMITLKLISILTGHSSIILLLIKVQLELQYKWTLQSLLIALMVHMVDTGLGFKMVEVQLHRQQQTQCHIWD